MERNFNWVQRRVTQVSLGSWGILPNQHPTCTPPGSLHPIRAAP